MALLGQGVHPAVIECSGTRAWESPLNPPCWRVKGICELTEPPAHLKSVSTFSESSEVRKPRINKS